MILESRASFGWPATAAGSATPTHGIAVHFDGNDQGLAGKPHSACRTYWKNTRRFHMGPSRGWLDIGYSFGCCPHGVVFEGRGLGHQQAAQPGGNSTWYSCTFMSGPGEKPPTVQVAAFREFRSWLRGKGVAAALRGHRDFVSTDCPGDTLYQMVKDGTLATGGTPATQEDGMATAAEVWGHEIPAPWDPKDPKWEAGTHLKTLQSHVRATEAKVDAQGADLAEVKTEVAALRADVGQLADAFDAEIAEIKALLSAPKE